MTDKPLFIPLKTEYYNSFECGEKSEEFRLYGKRWNENTCTIGRNVIISKGYGTKNRLYGVVVGFRIEKGRDLPNKQSIMSIYGSLDVEIACIKIKLDR